MRASLLLILSLIIASPALAQFSNPEPAGTEVRNAEPLRPPPGARAAIVEFEDLQCSDCARANPIVQAAVKRYRLPWVRHDFPLPFHTWSFQAAVDARWFDGEKLGDAFRDAVFAAQPTIQSEEDLKRFAGKFAREHGLLFPAVPDPQGKLESLVKADYALGQSVGIQHTPTIWVVTDRTSGRPFVEVIDRSRLDQMVEQALAETAH